MRTKNLNKVKILKLLNDPYSDAEYENAIIDRAIKMFELKKGKILIDCGDLTSEEYWTIYDAGFIIKTSEFDYHQYEWVVVSDREELMLFKVLFNYKINTVIYV